MHWKARKGATGRGGVGLVGHGLKPDLSSRLAKVEAKITQLSKKRVAVSAGPYRLGRPWGEIESAVTTVLGSAGELRARDVQSAVEDLLGEPVSRSSVKNCLAAGVGTRFERMGRGRYRLV
jgi:hypothetical protein